MLKAEEPDRLGPVHTFDAASARSVHDELRSMRRRVDFLYRRATSGAARKMLLRVYELLREVAP